ncbi:AAA family ATPase [Chryseobacterium sp. MEBOG06]|uniref:AAA family ATPase n=1 Tax=Chryseobacterium sp. MEBOG06 TaxID=2879938 RepID=UPI0039782B82|nr:AAA family ATPase [Chryseobacterium sp. MEBOG06]
MGYKLFPQHQNVIFISTEDDPTSTSISIKKPISKIIQDTDKDISLLNHLKFIFEVDTNLTNPDNIFNVLARDLKSNPTDLIVVDAFTDIFSGDINSSTKVREFLNQFSKIAKTYNCLILFLHHTGKKVSKFSASKDNVLGSQAFEAKMRVVLELKPFPNDENLRTLTITKGNYISSKLKKYSKILSFDEDTLLFSDTGKFTKR